MGEVIWVVLARVLRVTTKKRVVNFFWRRSAPPDKILATPMSVNDDDGDNDEVTHRRARVLVRIVYLRDPKTTNLRIKFYLSR